MIPDDTPERSELDFDFEAAWARVPKIEQCPEDDITPEEREAEAWAFMRDFLGVDHDRI